MRKAPASKEMQLLPQGKETAGKMESTGALQSSDLKGSGLLVSLILAGTVLILAALVVLMFFRQRETEPVQARLASFEASGPSKALPSLPQALLVDVGNVTKRKTMILEKEVTSIGRGENNDVPIPEKTVSGYHATIEYRNGTFYLEDQRSRNKTYLNGDQLTPFTPQRLKSGDEITFTDSRFVFLIAYQTPSGETVVVGEN